MRRRSDPKSPLCQLLIKSMRLITGEYGRASGNNSIKVTPARLLATLNMNLWGRLNTLHSMESIGISAGHAQCSRQKLNGQLSSLNHDDVYQGQTAVFTHHFPSYFLSSSTLNSASMTPSSFLPVSGLSEGCSPWPFPAPCLLPSAFCSLAAEALYTSSASL